MQVGFFKLSTSRENFEATVPKFQHVCQGLIFNRTLFISSFPQLCTEIEYGAFSPLSLHDGFQIAADISPVR